MGASEVLVCLYVCMSVTGLQLGLHIHVVLHTFLACAIHGAIITMEVSEDGRHRQAREQVQSYKRRLTAQQEVKVTLLTSSKPSTSSQLRFTISSD